MVDKLRIKNKNFENFEFSLVMKLMFWILTNHWRNWIGQRLSGQLLYCTYKYNSVFINLVVRYRIAIMCAGPYTFILIRNQPNYQPITKLVICGALTIFTDTMNLYKILLCILSNIIRGLLLLVRYVRD